ncbi:MAG TPA: Hsp20/alpha crystallin family protein [Thiobacillus sp.]
MTSITRHTPFGVADPFGVTDPLDHLFRGFFRPVEVDKRAPQIRMDVKEDTNSYCVHADIPGVNKDDIQVSIDGNTVSISAEVKKQVDQKEGESMLRNERYFGRVSRSFALENEIDESASSARYQDGVLELVLPKKVAVAAKRLTIQ